MRKSEQIETNRYAMNNYELATEQLNSEKVRTSKRLRTCQAWVMETTDFYILQSYNTIVAVIDKEQDMLIDVLRIVFGYTATSAQHIRKFSKDYGKSKWGCEHEITAR